MGRTQASGPWQASWGAPHVHLWQRSLEQAGCSSSCLWPSILQQALGPAASPLNPQPAAGPGRRACLRHHCAPGVRRRPRVGSSRPGSCRHRNDPPAAHPSAGLQHLASPGSHRSVLPALWHSRSGPVRAWAQAAAALQQLPGSCWLSRRIWNTTAGPVQTTGCRVYMPGQWEGRRTCGLEHDCGAARAGGLQVDEGPWGAAPGAALHQLSIDARSRHACGARLAWRTWQSCLALHWLSSIARSKPRLVSQAGWTPVPVSSCPALAGQQAPGAAC